MTVDQTGENILFVIEDGAVEAHIQIQYDPATDAAKFAWIIPVTSTPTFAVGSQQLFANVAAGTVPSYGYAQQNQPCGSCTPGGFTSTASTSMSTTAGDGGFDDSGGEDTGGTDVLLEQTVGAFDAVVLQSTSADELVQWLGENGYYQDPDATPILQEYIDENFQFIALRLTPGAGVGEIHPIVIRYAGDEPCIPIRLTRIAAREDMAIRAYFLGDDRVVPTNYRHVEINPLAIDWLQLGIDYTDVVTRAVDAAEGRAFVTEYAGTATAVSEAGIWSPTWNADEFVDLEPIGVVNRLLAQGLVVSCDTIECTFAHPLVRGLLLDYLPVPVDLTEGAFWGNLLAHEAVIDMQAWDGAAFSAALAERVVEPGAHAASLLTSYPYLTRLFTTISPHEMLEDPLFATNPDLPEVYLTSQLARLIVPCEGGRTMTDLPVFGSLELLGGWPDVGDDLPAALRIEQMPPAGAPMVLVDNEATIEAFRIQWNDGIPDGNAGPGCGDDSSTGLSADDSDAAEGCGCSTGTGGGAFALVLVGAALRRRRMTRA